ncbi:uncharacterized protein LOC122509973 [Leptopilina heterotoma]|uniref:uncharacterized protein LOC122509973 n=1 Tax=Leptopilina heterotoma TaxID=63436 RepID=UPI001CA7CF08|nr:uncharacterized protein LOC122509973 [Leptopilina heterotoma]
MEETEVFEKECSFKLILEDEVLRLSPAKEPGSSSNSKIIETAKIITPQEDDAVLQLSLSNEPESSSNSKIIETAKIIDAELQLSPSNEPSSSNSKIIETTKIITPKKDTVLQLSPSKEKESSSNSNIIKTSKIMTSNKYDLR